jgi:hypothetical protein
LRTFEPKLPARGSDISSVRARYPRPGNRPKRVETAVIILVVAVTLVAVVAGAYWSSRARAERRAAMAALAGELGMAFDPDERRDFDARYRRFELFGRGHTRRAYNTISGTVDITRRPYRACLGDYRYSVTTSNGKTTTTTTYHVSYLILHTPYDGLPALLIRPEGFMDKVAGAIGFDDIDFESDEFSRKFFVKSPDRKFAYDVVTPRMMEFLLANGAPTLDLSGGAICLLDGARRWDPSGFKDRLAYLRRFFELWPEHLLTELDSRTPAPER